MSNGVGQVFLQVFVEVAGRLLVGAIETGFRSAYPAGPIREGVPEYRFEAARDVTKASDLAGIRTVAIVPPLVGTGETDVAAAIGRRLHEAAVTRRFVVRTANDAALTREFEAFRAAYVAAGAQPSRSLAAESRPLAERLDADALLVARYDDHSGRATTVHLALIEGATGKILWMGRSTNGQVSVAGATLAADSALWRLPARSPEHQLPETTSSAR